MAVVVLPPLVPTPMVLMLTQLLARPKVTHPSYAQDNMEWQHELRMGTSLLTAAGCTISSSAKLSYPDTCTFVSASQGFIPLVWFLVLSLGFLVHKGEVEYLRRISKISTLPEILAGKGLGKGWIWSGLGGG